MPGVLESVDIAFWTSRKIEELDDRHLLEALWALESVYKQRTDDVDHRRHLGRVQLERIFRLMQSLVQERVKSIQEENCVA